MIMDPSAEKEMDAYADADFVGNWNKSTAPYDVGTAKSRSGFFVMLFGCPLIWHSKLQAFSSYS